MNIDNIVFQNFRNFDFKKINTDKINIIYGKNASGKTNILEGIFTLLNGHSFKKSNVVIQKYDSKTTALKGFVDDNQIYIEINKKGKTIKVDSKKANILKLKEMFPTIIYSMDSFLSFKNKEYLFSLIDRNSFIEDKVIMNYLVEYKKLIKVKKKILSWQSPDEKVLKIANKKILEIMDEITKKRYESVSYINDNISEILKRFTDKNIKIEYRKDNVLENITQLEVYKRRVLTSLNKDKVEILFDNKNLFNYSSVGEKKVVLLSIVVTIVKHYNLYKKPVLLIDDLEGDLDSNSKESAFEILTSLPNQLFLTTLGEYLYNNANIIRL